MLLFFPGACSLPMTMMIVMIMMLSGAQRIVAVPVVVSVIRIEIPGIKISVIKRYYRPVVIKGMVI